MTSIEMVEDKIEDMMGVVNLGEILKKCRVCLMKNHFILSKVFFKLIFRIMLALLPFIFLK